MDYPAFVPTSVRDTITDYLLGSDNSPGVEHFLAEAETYHEDIAGDPSISVRDKSNSKRKVGQLVDDVRCLRRLGGDERMRDVYATLTKLITDDRQWRGFIHAAWSAKLDYSMYRENLKRAHVLKEKIATTATVLADLLGEYENTDMPVPDEFFVFSQVIGDMSNQASDEFLRKVFGREVFQIPTCRALERSMKTNRYDKSQQYGRQTIVFGDEMESLLRSLSRAASKVTLGESGVVAAVIESRQTSTKTEYVRGFAKILIYTHQFKLTPMLMNAMAVTANVVINKSDVDVSYDDVRKALAKLDG